jgi:hypothetical protein
MGDFFDSGRKFNGDLADHLAPRRAEPPDRWVDRLRHAWFAYLLTAVAVPLWLGCLVFTVLDTFWFRSGLGFVTLFFVTLPLVEYFRWTVIRIVSSRDPDTGEKLGPKK